MSQLIHNAIEQMAYLLSEDSLATEHHYRYAVHDKQILWEINDLHRSKPDLHIHVLVVGCEPSKQAEVQKAYLNHFNQHFLTLSFVEDTDAAVAMLHQIQPQVLIKVTEAVASVCYESDRCVVLQYRAGGFLRAPFSASFQVVVEGHEARIDQLFAQRKTEMLSDTSTRIEFLQQVKQIRKNTLAALSKNLPLAVSRLIDNTYNKFDACILFGLDIPNTGALQQNPPRYADFIRQLEHILSQTPDHIALIVVEDMHHRTMTEQDVQRLSLKYQNLVYFAWVPFAIDFIAAYVDGYISYAGTVLDTYSDLWIKPNFQLSLAIPSDTTAIEGYAQFITHLLSKENNVDKYLKDTFFQFALDNHVWIDRPKKYAYCTFLNSILSLKHDTEALSKCVFDYAAITPAEIASHAAILNEFDSIFDVLQTERYPDVLRQKMSAARAISFDMFDTLVCRDLAAPSDLFRFVECRVSDEYDWEYFNFKHIRIQAEDNKRRETEWLIEVSFDSIYEEFGRLAQVFNTKQINQIKEIEFDYELSVVKPKQRMVKEFYFSFLVTDYRSVISDIYLDNSRLKRLLDNCGIQHYDHLLSSATYGYLKHDGRLFPIYLDVLKKSGVSIAPHECFHTGDNPVSDGSSPQKHGIQSFFYNKSVENYKHSEIHKVLRLPNGYDTTNQSVLIGLFANKYFSNHNNLINYDSLFMGDIYNTGYMAIGPLLVGFTQWLYRRAQLNGIKTLYFLARDGWMLKHAFDQLYPESVSGIKTKYLYCSRRAFKYALLRNEHDVIGLSDLWFSVTSLKNFLKVRFNLELAEIPAKTMKKFGYTEHTVIHRMSGRDKLFGFMREIAPIILKKAALSREVYLDYLKSEGFCDDETYRSIAIVDIGYGASMQLNFMKLLGIDNLAGFYVVTRNIHVTRQRFNAAILEGYLVDMDEYSCPTLAHPINAYIQLFESLLSSDEGTLVEVEKNDQGFGFKLVDVALADDRISRFKRVQRGAQDFVLDYVQKIHPVYGQGVYFAPQLASKVLLSFASEPLLRDAQLFCGIEFEDDLTCSSSSLIDTSVSNTAEQNISRSAWKEGAEIVSRARLVSAQHQHVADEHPAATSNTSVSGNTTLFTSSQNNASRQLVTVGAVNQSDMRYRMLNKLERTPYRFFSDSQIDPLRKLSVLFKPNSTQEKIARPVLHFILRQVV